MRLDRKGQMSILGLIFLFLTITVFGALQPALNDVVEDAANNASGSVEQNIIQLIPLFIVVMIVASVVIIGSGGSPVQRSRGGL